MNMAHNPIEFADWILYKELEIIVNKFGVVDFKGIKTYTRQPVWYDSEEDLEYTTKQLYSLYLEELENKET